jgi:hypothetical protein
MDVVQVIVMFIFEAIYYSLNHIKLHPITGHEVPEGSRDIAVLFL